MNTADWSANGERCLHCDTPLAESTEAQHPGRKLSPLARLRHRLQLREQLSIRNKPAYV
jgi:hypothetical protein